MLAIVILVGGKGTRVADLTKGKSKAEIEILKRILFLDKKNLITKGGNEIFT